VVNGLNPSTVGSKLLIQLQLSKHVGYLNAFRKPQPLFLAPFITGKLVIAVQRANIECLTPPVVRRLKTHNNFHRQGKDSQQR